MDAVDALHRAISINPRASSYYYVLSHVYRRLGREEDSRKALDSFVRLEKETADLEETRRKLGTRSANRPQTQSQRD
jgi:tetratricopeptide (TPR) repeat protein